MKSITDNLKTSKNRLYLLFAAYGAFFLLFTLLLLTQGYMQKKAPREIETDWMPSIIAVNAINILTSNYRTLQAVHILNTDSVEMNEVEQTLQRIDDGISSWRNKYEPAINSEQEKALYQKFVASYQDYRVISKQILALSQNNENQKAITQLNKTHLLFVTARSYLLELMKINNQGATEAIEQSDAVFARTKVLNLGSSLFMTALTLVLAFMVMSSQGAFAKTDYKTTFWLQARTPLVFLMLVLCISSFSYLSFKRTEELNTQTKELTSNWLPSIISVNKINSAASNYRRAEAMYIALADSADRAVRTQDMQNALAAITLELKKYKALISSKEEQNNYDEFFRGYNDYLAISQSTIISTNQSETDKTIALFKQSGILYDDFSSKLNSLVELNEQGGINCSHEISVIFDRMKIGLIGGGLALLVFLAICAQLLDLWAEPVNGKKISISKLKPKVYPKALTIKLKIRLAFLGMVGLFVFFAVQVDGLMNEINQQSIAVGNNWMPSIIVTNAISAETLDHRLTEVKLILTTDMMQKERFEKELNRRLKKISVLRSNYEPMIFSEEERTAYQNFVQLYERYLLGVDKSVAFSKQKDFDNALKEYQRNIPVRNAFTLELNKLVKLNQQGGIDAVHSSERIFNLASRVRLLLGLLVVMISITFILQFEKDITGPLQRLTKSVQRLASGDITGSNEFEGRYDELGQMADAVNDVTKTVKNLINDSVELIDAARAGSLSARIEVGLHPGEFNKIVFGMNQLLEVLSKPLEEVAEVMQNLALGDLAGRIKGEYEGELRALKVNVNRSLDALVNLLSELKETSCYLAHGDLTHQLSGNYQGEFSVLKANFNRTIEQLKQILQVILTNTGTSASAITQTSEASMYVAKEVSLQKTALTEIARTIEETALSINEVSQSATKGNQLACATSKSASEGQAQLDKLMQLIQHVASEYSRIEQITNEITRIADKTHLLSLNAGLEATRAGEHGLGFGFVAQQIGKLAEEVGISARDIGTVISSSSQSVRLGVTATQETRTAMEQIAHSAQASEQTVLAISAAIVEQSIAVSLLSQRVQEVQDGSKTTASAADEISVTMIHLADTIRQTAAEAQRFTLS
jgi:methyl-accepting chemotaxis protein